MGDEERVAEILADWLDAQERGEAIDPVTLIRAHPDLSDPLRRGFAALDYVDLALGKDKARPADCPERIGPYRIEGLLGTGGMGTVYRAVTDSAVPPVDAGTSLALKVIHPHLLRTPGFFKRFLREADLGRRVDHANVVRTLDVDAVESEGRAWHFLVMEYVQGQTLRELLDEIGRAPEALCRHVGREIAGGLQAVHEAGAIHRDLKPENVLITPDQVVKVMDLGVARLVDEQMRLSRTGMFVGSVLYAAPEQFERAELDARSDLYALGLILYELATGQHPYRDDSLSVVMHKQMEVTPRKAGEVNPQLSPFFEELCHTLLAKDRNDRFSSAQALIEALEAAEEGAWWSARAKALRAATKRPLRRIRIPRDTALYGRDGDLEALAAAYETACAGQGHVVLLEGEAGIGKTRLVDEFVGRLEARGERPHFLFGVHAPGSAPSGSGAYGEALRDHFGAESLGEALTMLLPDTPDLVDPFIALLRGERLPDGSAPLTAEARQTLIGRVVQALSTERPTVVMIDDLHLAPPEHRAIFASLARAVHAHRVLLVGAFRPGLPAAWLAQLQMTAHTARRVVTRLGPKDLVRMLAESLGSERLAEELAGRVGTKSDGNPYFVFEILRDLRERGLLQQQDDGSWIAAAPIHDIQIPSTIADLIEARLQDLVREERDLLEIAACVGFAFDPALVGEAAERSRLETLRTLGAIERCYGIVRSSGRSFVFDHHQVQETLYESLSPLLREDYHRAIARALEARNGGRAAAQKEADGALALHLCDQHQRAGDGRLALPYLTRALKHLSSMALHVDALELLDRLLGDEGLLTGRVRCDALIEKAARLERLGRREEDHRARAEAVALAEEEGDAALQADARQALGHHLERVLRNDEALAELGRSIELAQACGAEASELRARSCRGHVFRLLGRGEEARADYTRQLEIAQTLGKLRTEAQATGNLGLLAWDQGRYEEALDLHRRSLEAARTVGDRQTESRSAGNLGLACWNLGRYEEAETWHRLDLELSTKIADRWGETAATGNLGIVLHVTGRIDEGRLHHERMWTLAREIGDAECESVAAGNLASADRDLGRLSDALDWADLHLALAKQHEHRAGQVWAYLNLGTLYLVLGDVERAARHMEAGLGAARELNDRGREAEAQHALADLERAVGDPARAAALHEEAVGIRDEIGDAAGVAESRLALAVDREALGDVNGARDAIDTVLGQEPEHGKDGTALRALALCAALTGDGTEAALAGLGEHAARLTHAVRMETRFLLWRATEDEEHLRESRHLLAILVEHAPEEYRESMLKNVRLHREIMEAWAEHGQGVVERGDTD